MRFLIVILAFILGVSCMQKTTQETEESTTVDTLRYQDEKHLKNIKKLTFGGDNAEAYWSFDGSLLTFQSTS
ncbi:MAG TPA: hypothetical protein PKJ63_16415, partial [Cyclobacteriaceae bacterium]|nr:hypothetical protein [Cyclobacteriaceae bacterium]